MEVEITERVITINNMLFSINKMLFDPKQNVIDPLTNCLETKENKTSNKTTNKKLSKSDIEKYLSSINNPLLNIDSFREWLEYKNYDYQLVGINKLIGMLSKYSYDMQQEIVDKSIMNNYKGIFKPKGINIKDNSKNDDDDWSDGVTRCDPDEWK